MSFFRNLFRLKKAAAPHLAHSAPSSVRVPNFPSESPGFQGDPVLGYDKFGRELRITRFDWFHSVLQGNMEKAWDDAESLASQLIHAFHDGFFLEVEAAAVRLAQIDPQQDRGASLLAIVYLQTERPREAETVLTQHIARHGESGVILTNLAKAQSALDREEESLRTLWRALELDPNQDNALAWYEVVLREKDGEAASTEALRRIAALPGSWRAQLWLARHALDARNLDAAKTLYAEALAQAPTPRPADLLKQMSGDLGQRGYLVELLTLTTPHFDASLHGLEVGNNLIEANLDAGQLDAARVILRRLHQMQRPDWKQHLDFWESELAKLETVTIPPVPYDELKVTLLDIRGPLWLQLDGPFARHFPQPDASAPRVIFLGASLEKANPSTETAATVEPSDNPGRMSRAWPLFLCECFYLGGKLHTTTYLPWIVQGGFAVQGVRSTDEGLCFQARGSQGENKADYVIATHLVTRGENWNLQFRLLRVIDKRCLAEFGYDVAEMQFHPHIHQILDDLSNALATELGDPVPACRDFPSGVEFDHYLFRLEQCLATSCNSLDGVRRDFLHNAADILNGMVHLCLQNPEHIPSRLLLLRTARALKENEKEFLSSFREKLLDLMIDYPVAEPIQGKAIKMLKEVVA
jgi:tetratricopeptide (TPR) repeat protein